MNDQERTGAVKIRPPERQREAPPSTAAPEAEPRATKTIAPAPPRAPRTAVVVCHGMGQQVPFETLGLVAEALQLAERERRNGATAPAVDVKLVQVRDKRIPRAETTVTAAGGAPREVHLYEAYWAPSTAGKIGALEVALFLVGAGRRGVAWFLSPSDGTTAIGHLRRWMFGRFVDLELGKLTAVYLAAAVLVVIAASALFASTAYVGASLGLHHAFRAPVARSALVTKSELYGAAFYVALGFAPAVAWVLLSEAVKGRVPALARAFRGVTYVAVFVALLVLVVEGSWLPFAVVLRGRAPSLATHPVFGGVDLVGTFWWRLAFWIAMPSIFLVVRWFLAEFLGDVAIYVSSHKVSRFQATRDEIQRRSLEVARAVYGARDGTDELLYDRVLMVGHSLGSVVAYDTLNALINEDLVANTATAEPLDVLARTPLLLTFGSPLDKTAFLFRTQRGDTIEVREALAAAVQPLIQRYDLRPEEWINIHSGLDWVSGSIEYYDDPKDTANASKHVRNVVDPEAVSPLISHTQYWKHKIFRETLYDRVIA